MTVGEYLKQQRERRGMSLRDVESALLSRGSVRISSGHLSLIEQGKVAAPAPRTLHALAGALDLDYLTLMTEAGYLDRSDLKTRPASPAPAFRGAERLSPGQIREVEDYIEFLKRKKHPRRRGEQGESEKAG